MNNISSGAFKRDIRDDELLFSCVKEGGIADNFPILNFFGEEAVKHFNFFGDVG